MMFPFIENATPKRQGSVGVMSKRTYTILVTETITHKVNVEATNADEANEIYCAYEGNTDIVSEPYTAT